MAASGHIDALSQFELHPVFGAFGRALDFSQSNVMMLAAMVLTLLLLWLGMRPARHGARTAAGRGGDDLRIHL